MVQATAHSRENLAENQTIPERAKASKFGSKCKKENFHGTDQTLSIPQQQCVPCVMLEEIFLCTFSSIYDSPDSLSFIFLFKSLHGFCWLYSVSDTLIVEHSSSWYTLSLTNDFMKAHGRSSASILGPGSGIEQYGNSIDDGPGGCALIWTERKSAALLKSAEWHMSLGDDGKRPSESDPRWCGCKPGTGLVEHPSELLLVLVEGVTVLNGLWYRYGETGLVGTLSDCKGNKFVDVSQKRQSSESSDIGEYCQDISSLENRIKDRKNEIWLKQGKLKPSFRKIKNMPPWA